MGVQSRAAVEVETSVAATFDVLAWEIELAGARCIFLDTLIGELMPTVPPEKRDRLMQGMHAVDLLSQHLTSLSAFSRRLSQVAPAQACPGVAQALGDITLGDLADRMWTAFGGAEDASDERAEAGDLDLF